MNQLVSCVWVLDSLFCRQQNCSGGILRCHLAVGLSPRVTTKRRQRVLLMSKQDKFSLRGEADCFLSHVLKKDIQISLEFSTKIFKWEVARRNHVSDRKVFTTSFLRISKEKAAQGWNSSSIWRYRLIIKVETFDFFSSLWYEYRRMNFSTIIEKLSLFNAKF